MPKNIFKILLLTFICLFISACQHGIRSNELEYPPELDQSGIDVSTLDPVEAERRLKEINDTPYPPHTIQSGDTFRIKVYGEDDLTDGGGSNSNSMVTPAVQENKPKINVDADSIIVNDNVITDDEFFDDFFNE